MRHMFRRYGTFSYTNFKLGKWMEYDDPNHRHDAKGQRSIRLCRQSACLPITIDNEKSQKHKNGRKVELGPDVPFRAVIGVVSFISYCGRGYR